MRQPASKSAHPCIHAPLRTSVRRRAPAPAGWSEADDAHSVEFGCTLDYNAYKIHGFWTPIQSIHHETKIMNRPELNYRERQHHAFPPRHHAGPPHARGSLHEDTEQRILTLYESGWSIELIARELRRGRHLIVHILQSKGVFGKRRSGPAPEDSRGAAGAAEVRQEDPVVHEASPESTALEGAEPAAEVQGESQDRKTVRRARLTGKPNSAGVDDEAPKPSKPRKSKKSGPWSPQVVEALLKVVAERELDSGMSFQEVRKLVSGARRKAH